MPSSPPSCGEEKKPMAVDDEKKDASSVDSFNIADDVENGGSSDGHHATSTPASNKDPSSSATEDEHRPLDPMLVDFDGPHDPDDPKHWPVARRVGVTVATAMMTFVVTFASSVFSVAIAPVAAEFGVSTTVSTLGVSLFLLGFTFGPIVFGPASEVLGRRPPLLAGFALFAVFQVPVAVARSAAVVLVFRFLGGFAASAPLAILGGIVADLWAPVARAYAVCFFAFVAFGGPVLGPITGAFVTQAAGLGWRWTAWLTLIAAAAFGVIGVWLLPETSGQRILQLRARRRRKETGNAAWRAAADENPLTLRRVFAVYLVRPWTMLAHEPILALLTAYMSFVYGVLYMLFEAFPVSFHDERGWNLGVSTLPFCSFIVGTTMGCALMSYSAATNFKRAFIKHGVCIPEERLPPMMVGAIMLPIGFFWFGWTSNPSIIWVPQALSTALIAMGMVVTFWEGMAYIIDCYGFYSNSAIAVNTFIRSIAGAVFPLFATYMYNGLGVDWASSLLGFLCLLFAPAPFLFYKYGARVRARSRWVPT